MIDAKTARTITFFSSEKTKEIFRDIAEGIQIQSLKGERHLNITKFEIIRAYTQRSWFEDMDICYNIAFRKIKEQLMPKGFKVELIELGQDERILISW